jgi:hypothetical protein
MIPPRCSRFRGCKRDGHYAPEPHMVLDLLVVLVSSAILHCIARVSSFRVNYTNYKMRPEGIN